MLKVYPKAKIIFGAETPEQVKSNLNIKEEIELISDDIESEARRLFSDVEEKLLNPALWPI